VDGGGQYLLAVKGNQPALQSEVTETFAAADDERVRAVDEEARAASEAAGMSCSSASRAALVSGSPEATGAPRARRVAGTTARDP
jgi:hypothetical protein